MAAPEHGKAIRRGFPVLVFIGQYSQTCYRFFVSIKETVVVDKHPFGKFSLFSSLHFHMDIDPALATIQNAHPDKAVNKSD